MQKVQKVIPWAMPSSESYGIINNSILHLYIVTYTNCITVQLEDTIESSGHDYERFFRRKLKLRIIVYKM
jgi:hypothetical protein